MIERRNATLYVGVTNHLLRGPFNIAMGSAFTAKYGLKTLVWYEHYNDVREAITSRKRASSDALTRL